MSIGKYKNKYIIFEKNTIRKAVKIGFSWTVLLFSWIALAIRGQVVPAIVCFLLFGIPALYYMFTANRLLKEQLLLEGWKETPMKEEDKALLPSIGQKILLAFCFLIIIIFSIVYGGTCAAACMGAI